MSMRYSIIAVAVVVFVIGIVVLVADHFAIDNQTENGGSVQRAAPAAVWCVDENNGIYNIVEDAQGGQSGECRLPYGGLVTDKEYYDRFRQ